MIDLAPLSAQPLLRKAVEGREDTLTREEAEKILIECMKVLYYRDARSLNKVSLSLHSSATCMSALTAFTHSSSRSQFQIATVTSEGVEVSETKSAETTWGFAEKLRGYGAQTQ